MQGNPLAINYAEWLALIRYLIPSLKHWIFDKQLLKIEHMSKINEENWNELLINFADFFRLFFPHFININRRTNDL
jgi:hypothetical protein